MSVRRHETKFCMVRDQLVRFLRANPTLEFILLYRLNVNDLFNYCKINSNTLTNTVLSEIYSSDTVP